MSGFPKAALLSDKTPPSRQAQRFGLDKATAGKAEGLDSDGDVPFCSAIDVRQQRTNKNKRDQVRAILAGHLVCGAV